MAAYLFIYRPDGAGWPNWPDAPVAAYLFIYRPDGAGWPNWPDAPGAAKAFQAPSLWGGMGWGCPLSTTYFIILFFLSFLKKEDERL